MLNVDNPRNMTVEGILEYLGRFDPVFSVEISEAEIKKYIKDTLGGKELYATGYTVPWAFTDLLVSLMNKDEVTGKDLVNLGLSIHGYTLDGLKPETSLHQTWSHFKEVAEAIKKEDRECTVEFRGLPHPGDGFSAEIVKYIDDWKMEFILEREGERTTMMPRSRRRVEEEESSAKGPIVRLNIEERELKYRHRYAEGGEIYEDPEAAEERLQILKKKEFSKLIGNGLVEIEVDLPGSHLRRKKSLEVEKPKETAYERVIEALKNEEETKIYNPEELVKGLLGIKATTSIPMQKMDVEYKECRRIGIRSSDISEEGWRNLKNFAGDALRALS